MEEKKIFIELRAKGWGSDKIANLKAIEVTDLEERLQNIEYTIKNG